MRKTNERLFTPDQELEICAYYWTRLPNGFYPSYKETGEHFGCSAPLIKLILKRNNCRARTAAETREGRPCKPINQPIGDAPLCACGCKTPVQWISKDSKWQKYAPGHYSGIERKTVQPAYKPDSKQRQRRAKKIAKLHTPKAKVRTQPLAEILTLDVLKDLYCDKLHTVSEIAEILNVGVRSVNKAMKTHGIEIRALSESLVVRGSVRGRNNPAWKGGVADWDYAYNWKTLCKKIKDRDKWTCQLCGETRKRWGHYLHVHHIDENKTNNHPHNLISLCAKCHAPAHGKKTLRKILKSIAVSNTSAIITPI